MCLILFFLFDIINWLMNERGVDNAAREAN
ncbi:Uncharacterised protein [Streptococcus equinus]|jgi:hypothetical protein|uniref:Uncharacterized protein n=1 Tax=Streptococcus equinus TaxID=1335 RepID=A0A1G9M2P4_STREI|nr:hypothetical protein SAMN05216400_1323 [Streptococcus equinus]SEL19792.1 hypothetical protein SAMN05216373_1609 [Streptococcus equinus]SFQ76102.1 hypothetical protein SAMN05216422_1758 [Streptococcus equinus]SUN69555.1 Uncharacterised protein [Streptococcus equinus]SUO79141.1 Uncharacterised protein [Streptococcus equinus]